MSGDELLQFPCDFPIKVMGLAGVELDQVVVEILRRHAPGLQESAITSRPSRHGKYLAVTANIRARDQAQLDAIYAELSAHDQVILAL